MLARVTITGADDGVDPRALVALAREFPFVEWGILMSTKRQGTARYPSHDWIVRLMVAASGTPTMLSAHLCGDRARGALAGDVNEVDSAFQRHQINGFTAPAARLVALARTCPIEFILQVRDEAQIQPAADVARAIGTDAEGRASLLYDPSGGRGIEPFRWPVVPFGVRMGYAGGIRPDTVEEVISAIPLTSEPYWIDMESGVRVGDRFDLDLCREVLTRARPLVDADASAAEER